MLRTASIAFIAVMLVAVTGTARAQQEPPPQGAYQQEPPPQGAYQQQPPPQGAYQQEPPPQGAYQQQPPPQTTATQNQDGSIRVVEQGSPEAQAVTAKQGRGVELGGHLVVPFYVNRPDLQPGIGIQGRLGWEFPHGLTVELNIGVQVNRFNDPVFNDYLTAAWIGGGIRYAFLNPSAFVPFIGVNLQASLWSQCLETYSGSGTCSGNNLTAGVGLMPLVGVAWELNPKLALELGVQTTISFFNKDSGLVLRGGADPVSVYVSPFLGGTVYF